MTAVIPGNGHRTAIPRTAFRAFVTVVAALFQELGVYTAVPSLRMPWAAFRAFVTVVPEHGHQLPLPRAAFGVCDCCDYTTPGNGHPLPLHFGGVAVVIPRNGTTMPRAEFRENSFMSCIPGNRHQD